MKLCERRAIPVSETGRMNLPADLRRALGLSDGGYVIATLEDDEVRLTTARHAVKRAQALMAPYRSGDKLASDKLIAERRQAARREEIENQRSTHDE